MYRSAKYYPVSIGSSIDLMECQILAAERIDGRYLLALVVGWADLQMV
jgi:hypothetical protein